MTICGYHERMGSGLAEFGEGLIAAITRKASTNSRTIREQMASEEDQIAILEQFLSRQLASMGGSASAPGTATAFAGLVTMCHGLLASSLSSDAAGDFAENVRAEVARLVQFLQAYEDAYEEPSGTMSNSERTSRAWSKVHPGAALTSHQGD